MKKILLFLMILLPVMGVAQSSTDFDNWIYEGDKSITEYRIPDGVHKIGYKAFDSCVNLQTIKIPASVESIGMFVFYNCPSLKKIIVDKNNKHFCTMDGALFTNDQKTLVYCPNMMATDDYKIPRCVTTIGKSAFLCCKNLTKVIIPKNVEVIGESAFEECTNIEYVFISENVREINLCAFSGCHKLQKFEVDPNNKYFSTIDGVLYNYDKTKLIICPNKKEYIIPSGTKIIGQFAFQGNKDMVSVAIPNCVEKIESGAFSICNGLTEITIPESVTEIGHLTFCMSKNLKTVKLPNGLKKISESTFKRCESLENVTIPENVEEIEKEAFYQCKSLKTIIIPKSVKMIGKSAFVECENLESVIIENGVRIIGESAFLACYKLQSITLPESVEIIERLAFALCNSLTHIDIPKSVNIINEGAFVRCEKLESATIHAKIIGDKVFAQCPNLQSVNIAEGCEKIGRLAFSGCGLEYVIISEGINEVDTSTFYQCKKLTSITLPKSLKRIRTRAFAECDNLKTITIPSSVQEIEEDAFCNISSISSDDTTSVRMKLLLNTCMMGIYKRKARYDSLQCYALKNIDILKHNRLDDVNSYNAYVAIADYYNLIGDYDKMLQYSEEGYNAMIENYGNIIDSKQQDSAAINKYIYYSSYLLLQTVDANICLNKYEQAQQALDLFERYKYLKDFEIIKYLHGDSTFNNIIYHLSIDESTGMYYYYLMMKLYLKMDNLQMLQNYASIIDIKVFLDYYQEKTHRSCPYICNIVDYWIRFNKICITDGFSFNMFEALKSDLMKGMMNNVEFQNYKGVNDMIITFGDCYYTYNNFDSAFAYYSKSFNYELDRLKDNFSFMNTYQRQNYWEEHRISFENIVKISTQLPNNDSATQMAYNSLLVSKGLILASEQNLTSIILNSKDDKLKNNFFALKTYRTQLDTVKNEKSRDSIRALAEHLETDLMQRSSQFADITNYMNIDWQKVRNSLGDNDVAVEFFFNNDSLYALALKKDFDAPKLVVLDGFNTKLSYYTNTDIYNSVWKPLEQYLSPDGKVYFSPSGVLYNIAIEYAPMDATHLISEKYKIYRISSTRNLALKKEQSSKNKVGAVFGGIEYNFGKGDWEDLKEYADNIQVAFRDVPLIEDTTLRSGVSYLAGSKLEYEAVSKILKDANYQLVENTTGITATEELFKKLSGQGISNMLISTHGFYQPKDTVVSNSYEKEDISLSQSGLLFAGANSALDPQKRANIPEGVDDGILTAKEISRMDLKGLDLVVLSACQTGLGEVTSEGVFGLQRGFKKAGANTIVMSLWKVDDNATKDLMTEFYKNLVSGKSKREAFLAAQAVLRSKYKDPHKWAAFVMVDGVE